ncbi:MAG: hypothetical protein EOM87_06730 [Clostridia bacterium]|nr:hypothetical protein [Clostridia bacterium]
MGIDMKNKCRFTSVILVIVISVAFFTNISAFKCRADSASSVETLLVNAIYNFKESVDVKGYGITTNNVKDYLDSVYEDYPNLFYFTEYEYNYDNKNSVTKISFKYIATKSEYESMKIQYEAEIQKVGSCISSGMTDIEKVIAVHDYLVLQTKYDEANYIKGSLPSVSYSSYGCIVKKVCVCAGYARAFCDIMNRLDIDVKYIESDGMNHAWNMVKVDGRWYHVDVTWGDAICSPDNGWENDDYDIEGRVSHKYLLLSDNGIKGLNHYGWSGYNVPTASSTIYEGLFEDIDTGMFYGNSKWYFCQSGKLRCSPTDRSYTNDVLGETGCTKLYIYGGAIYYVRNNTDTSEIRRVLNTGTEPLIVFDNGDNIVKNTITEFIISGGQLKYTVHSVASDKSTDTYRVKRFNASSVVSGLSDSGYYNSFTVNFEEGTAKLDGKSVASGTAVSEEGSHTLIIRDTAGNELTLNIRIDRTSPVVTGVLDGESYSDGRTILFDEGTATLDGKKFTNGSYVSSRGTHTLIVTDEAGNITKITFSLNTSHFSIDTDNVPGIISFIFENADLTIAFIVGMILFCIILKKIIASLVYRKMKKTYYRQMTESISLMNSAFNEVNNQLNWCRYLTDVAAWTFQPKN